MDKDRFTDHELATPLVQRLAANIYVWLFGRKAFYQLNLGLLRLAVHGIGFGNLSAGRISPGEDRLVRRLVTIPNLHVLDVGAYEGEYSTRLRRLSPTAKVWAFEPNPTTYQRLYEVAAKEGFTAIKAGMSDRPGKLRLYDYHENLDRAGSSHASLYGEVFERIHHAPAETVEVDLMTVDAFIEGQGIPHLNLLKVDAEGHELAILRGAREAITSHRVDIVQFEVNEMNVMSRVFFKDFYDVLPEFVFYRMVHDGLAPIGPYQPRTHELFFLQNVVAIRDDLDYRSRLV